MVRFQFQTTFLICIVMIVSLGAFGIQSVAGGEQILSAATNYADDTSKVVEAGYAEVDNCWESCPIDTECCPVDTGGCCPTAAGCLHLWTAEAGVIFLSRDRADARPSAKVYGSETGQTTPTMVFDMAASDVGTAVGHDIVLTRCLGAVWDLETRYFQIDGWNDSHSFDNYDRTYVSAYGTIADTQSPSFAYSSRLYNIELNLRWKYHEQMPLLMGFRTLGLDEHFQIISNGNLGTPWAETSTNNSLYGLQIGMEPILWDRGKRFRLEGLIKAGVYGNSAHQRTSFPTAQSELDSRTDGTPSFVGELGLIGVYKLNKYWSLRAGYEVLWITNVALAPDQASSITFGGTPTGDMDDKAIAFYYGATASIERRF